MAWTIGYLVYPDSPILAHHAPAHAVVILTAPSLMLIEAAVASTAASVVVTATAAPRL